MSRFMHDNDYPEFQQTLKEFVDKHGFNTALDVLLAAADGETRQNLLYRKFCLKKNETLDTTSRSSNLTWLNHRREHYSKQYKMHHLNHIPGGDHIRRIKTTDGKRTLLSQPYGLYWRDLQALVDWCKDNNLQADIDTYSGHYPGHTLAIRITSTASEVDPKD